MNIGFWGSLIISSIYVVSNHPRLALVWLVMALFWLLSGIRSLTRQHKELDHLINELTENLNELHKNAKDLESLVSSQTPPEEPPKETSNT